MSCEKITFRLSWSNRNICRIILSHIYLNTQFSDTICPCFRLLCHASRRALRQLILMSTVPLILHFLLFLSSVSNKGGGKTWGVNKQIFLSWLKSSQAKVWLMQVTVYTCQSHIMTLIRISQTLGVPVPKKSYHPFRTLPYEAEQTLDSPKHGAARACPWTLVVNVDFWVCLKRRGLV